jgi:peptidoglycan/xylan/chitin deacetylase (PgdA/CDA1 family)
MNRRVRGVVVASAAVGLAHALPAACGIAGVRRRWFPRVAGVGRGDHIALTFDDGPDEKSTPEFLDGLAALGWRATFFMLGSMVRRAPALAAEVAKAGHEIALHGFAHDSHLLQPPGRVLDDLRRGYAAVAEGTGQAPAWVRPPYGHVATATIVGARELRTPLVLWTAWGRDWRSVSTPTNVVSEIERGLTRGGTVLLHDSDCTSAPGSWRAAAGALPLLAERLAERGWTAGPLGEHGLGLR